MNRFFISLFIGVIAAFAYDYALSRESYGMNAHHATSREFDYDYGVIMFDETPLVYRCYVVGEGYSLLSAVDVDPTGAYYNISGVITHLNDGQTFCQVSEMFGNWSDIVVL